MSITNNDEKDKIPKLNGNILIAWFLNIIKPNIIISEIWKY